MGQRPPPPLGSVRTSGILKILVNGGLRLGDRWVVGRAYTSEVGWALGDGEIHAGPEWDRIEARNFYHLLEHEIVPAFYTRDARGIPDAWVARMRASMATLAPVFNSNRMVLEYLERLYVPAARRFQERSAEDGALARACARGSSGSRNTGMTSGSVTWTFTRTATRGRSKCPCFSARSMPTTSAWSSSGAIGGEPVRVEMRRSEPLADAANAFVYRAHVSVASPAALFTARAIPQHPTSSRRPK